MRLFVAVDLPPSTTRRLAALDRPPGPTLRWTDPVQWHVTLRFLGEVDEPEDIVAALVPVGSVLHEVAPGPVEAHVGPSTAWFAGRRVLHVPVAGLDPLADVVTGLTTSLAAADDAGFAGHVTLARTRGRHRGPAALAGQLVEDHFEVRSITLYASTLAPDGPRYRVVSTFAVG